MAVIQYLHHVARRAISPTGFLLFEASHLILYVHGLFYRKVNVTLREVMLEPMILGLQISQTEMKRL